MTVKDLLESLAHYPPDAFVVIEVPDHQYRLARDWPEVATVPAKKADRVGVLRLGEDDSRESDADVRARGEKRVAVVVFR